MSFNERWLFVHYEAAQRLLQTNIQKKLLSYNIKSSLRT